MPARTRGAALMVDISGFTAMTQAMIDGHGTQRGPEKMAALLNRIFDAMVRPIHDFLGSVIAISGDAITCWFDDQIDDAVVEYDSAVARALACATAIQASFTELGTIDEWGGGQSVGIKAAIASGMVRRFLVGDPSLQQIEVIAGDPLDRMALAEALALRGEIVLSRDALELVADRVQVAETRASESGDHQVSVVGHFADAPSATPWPDFSDEQQRHLEQLSRPWLLPSVHTRLTSGQSEFLAEIRAISALFLHFGGIDYDRDDAAGAKLDAVVRWAQSIFSFHEGSLLHVTIGDKGSYLNGTFGAPLAHDNDASRAVSAAVELVTSRPPKLAFVSEVGAGLARGVMFAGAIGSSMGRVYGTSGAAANRAARLMQATTLDTVWCDEASAYAARLHWNFQTLTAIRVKGVEDELPVLVPLAPRLLGERESARQRTPDLIGREQERTQLMRALASLQEGRGGLLLIEGEPGIGKTALLDTIEDYARDDATLTLRCSGDAIDRSSPYHALRRVFEVLVDTNLTLPTELDPLRPLLNAVVGGNRPQTELIRQMTPEVRGENTQRLLLGMLTAAAGESPLLIVLDDAHWADATSLALITRAHREIAKLLLVIGMRPALGEQITEEISAILETPDLERMRLEPLGDDAVDTLLASVLGIDEIPEAMARRVREKAEGNPFFTREIALSLRERGSVRPAGVVAGAIDSRTEPMDLALPDTVQGIVTSRVDRLPPVPQLALKVASVIGRSFEINLLRDVHPTELEPAALEDALHLLIELELVQIERQRGDRELYAFRQSITRDVTYSHLTFAQRRALHIAIAEWYEHTAGAPVSQHYAVLAHHWEHAEVTDKTVHYLEAAGDQALDTSAHPEAAGFFTRLIELGDDADLSAGRWRLKLGRTHRGWGRFHDSRAWLEAALPYYREPLPATAPAIGIQTLRQLGVQGMHLLFASRILGRQADSPNETSEVGNIHVTLGELAFFAGRQSFSLYATIRALNALELAGDSADLSTAYAAVGFFSGLIGLRRLNRRYHARAVTIADDLQSPAALADALRLDSVFQISMGNWQTAREDSLQALNIHERLGDTRGHGDCLNMLSHIACFTGDFAETRSLSIALHDVAARSENPMHEIWALTWEGKALLRMGEYQRARALFAEVIEATQDEADIHDELCARANMAASYLHTDSYAEALPIADATLEWLETLDVQPSAYLILDAYSALADVYLGVLEAQGKFDSAMLDAARNGAIATCRLLRNHGRIFPIGRPASHLQHGRLAWHLGHKRRARRAWRRSIDEAGRLQMDYDKARAHHAIGRRCGITDRARRQHLEQAIETFKTLGTPREHSLAERDRSTGQQ